MPPNPYPRIARNNGLLAVASALVFAASLLHLATARGSPSTLVFCLPIVSGIVLLLTSVGVFGALRTAQRFDELTLGRGALVRWTVDDDTWRKFRPVANFAARRVGTEVFDERRFVALSCIGLSIVFAVVWPKKAGLGASMLLLVGCWFGALAWWVRRRSRAAWMETPPSTAYIGSEGMVFGGRYVRWAGGGRIFRGAKVDLLRRVLRVTFAWVRYRGPPFPDEVVVPIPVGKDDEAEQLAWALGR